MGFEDLVNLAVPLLVMGTSSMVKGAACCAKQNGELQHVAQAREL
jgi:hypothetical protein